MKIGIDARFWGLEHAGLGRYVIELTRALADLDKHNRYVLFVRNNYLRQISLPGNFTLKKAEIKHYSLEEQWLLADIFARENLDLLHVPHFNVPYFYRRPFVVTIHDLLWHEVKGLSVTTQNPLTYLVKYLGYRQVVNHALGEARAIIVPSNTIRAKLVGEHRLAPDRIHLTYEAPGKVFRLKSPQEGILKKYKLSQPFLLFTGSAYPHKNILKAVEAVKLVNSHRKKLIFAIVSARSVFLERLVTDILKMKAAGSVRLLGFVPDEDLAGLYSRSLALIQPSLSEGYGLTGLEAMAAGTPVIASDLEIFREIYSPAAVFIDPHSAPEMANKIELLLDDQNFRLSLINKGRQRARDFSWKNTARQTLEVYQSAVRP